MPVLATWIAAGGNWFDPLNWSVTSPPHVPGRNENVVIPDNTGTPPPKPFTITYNGTSTVNWVSGVRNATLDITGGSLSLLNGGNYNLMPINVGSGATLAITGGRLSSNGGVYAGTVSGAGTMQMTGGVFAINAGASFTVANWRMKGDGSTLSQVKLNIDLAYAGNLLLATGNFLTLNGHTLTLSRTAILDSFVTGPGTLKITGAAQTGTGTAGVGHSPLSMDGGAALEIVSGGSFVQHHDVNIGNGAAQSTLLIRAGATYTCDTTSRLGVARFLDPSNPAANAKILNEGALIVEGMTTSLVVEANLTNTGSIQVAAGNALLLDGDGSYVLGGSLAGSGTIAIREATATLTSTDVKVANLGVGNGGRLQFGNDLSYAGALSFFGPDAIMELGGHALTLSGHANTLRAGHIEGPGTIRIDGAASIGSDVTFGSAAAGAGLALQNAGAITQNGGVTLNGTLRNAYGATYSIDRMSTLSSNGAGGTGVVNEGRFTATGKGISSILGSFKTYNTLTVSSGAQLILGKGTERLGGLVTGPGTLVFGDGADATLDTTTLTVAALSIAGATESATLTLARDIVYGGKFSVANQHGHLELNGKTLTLSGAGTTLIGNSINGGGRLRITGAATIGGGLALGAGESSGKAMTLQNSGALTQTGSLTLNGSLLNDAGKTYAITSAGTIGESGSGGTITNNGDFSVTAAGSSEVLADFKSVGSLSVGTGATLALRGNTTLGGTIAGPGKVVLAGNAAITTASVTVGALSVSGGTTTLGTDLAYAGAFTIDSSLATIALNGHALTLTGATRLTGGTFRGALGKVDRLAVSGASVNLAAVRFSAFEATDTISITGTAAANTLTGSSQRDRIDGGGGNDLLRGGAGADQLIGGAGIDTASYAGSLLAVTVNLATGTATGGDAEGDSLSGIENLVGTDQIDTLTGDAGANTLDGGASSDILQGGAGADRLIGGFGTDTASYAASSLAVTVNLLTGVATGGDAAGDSFSGIDSLIGSTKGDMLSGNAGGNRLAGGLGNDTLTGGAGADGFVFDTALGPANIDVITDMTVGTDLVELSKSIFAALQGGSAPGSLAATSFRLSTQASASGGLGELIYNATTGSLAYDADGSGAGAAQLFARASAGLALSASSFRLA